MGIQRVAVVGGGQMGGGVAELTAKAGLPTVIKEVSAEAAEHSETGIRNSLDRGLERGKLDEAAHAARREEGLLLEELGQADRAVPLRLHPNPRRNLCETLQSR